MVSAQNAQAQSETPKVEVGAHYTLLRFRDFGPFNASDSGVGGRVTYNATDSFGIEGELNFFPQERINFSNGSSLDSKRMQALFGVKTGIRSEKAGIFGKFRPGFIRFSQGSDLLGLSATEFTMDIGGVFELYPSRPVAIRFDVGDTIIRFGGLGATSHNLQISTGVALRF
jgi:outer membrane scaffolding protein for murein synthesis (MipA/OmpV family)